MAKRCTKLCAVKSFATGKTASEYTMKTVSGKFKGKVQERRIKDYVKRLLKNDFFLRNSKSSLNIILLDISFLPPTDKKIPMRV